MSESGHRPTGPAGLAAAPQQLPLAEFGRLQSKRIIARPEENYGCSSHREILEKINVAVSVESLQLKTCNKECFTLSPFSNFIFVIFATIVKLNYIYFICSTILKNQFTMNYFTEF